MSGIFEVQDEWTVLTSCNKVSEESLDDGKRHSVIHRFHSKMSRCVLTLSTFVCCVIVNRELEHLISLRWPHYYEPACAASMFCNLG